MPKILTLASTMLSAVAAEAPSQLHLALTGDLSSMSISWRTATDVEQPAVEYKQVSTSKSSQVAADDTRTYLFNGESSGHYHHAEMVGLSSGQEYAYRVGDSANDKDWSEWFHFLAPRADTNMKLVFTGDFGMGGGHTPAGDGNQTAKAFCDAAASGPSSEPADLIWVAGDISYANGHGVKAFESTWNYWFDQLEPAFARVPTMVSPGNHETYLPTTEAATTGLTEAPAGFQSEASAHWNFTAFDARFRMPSRRSGGVRNMWYSFDLGAVHYVSVDTETDFPDAPESFLNGWGAQMPWLENDLKDFRERSPTGWLVVVGHKPMYSSAPGYTKNGQPSGESAKIQAAFEPLLVKYGADLYLCGHQHGYERSKPVRGGRSGEGPVHIVAAVPGGGCGITADWSKDAPSWTAAQWPLDGSPWNDRQDFPGELADLGYGILEANSTSLVWKFVLSQSGAVKDSYVIHRDLAVTV